MSSLPDTTLILLDANEEPFGCVRFAPNEDDDSKGECIFDLPEPGPERGDETRWLSKRHFQRKGEHRYKISAEGAVTISSGDFRVVLDPAEDELLRTRPPAPVMWARWA